MARAVTAANPGAEPDMSAVQAERERRGRDRCRSLTDLSRASVRSVRQRDRARVRDSRSAGRRVAHDRSARPATLRGREPALRRGRRSSHRSHRPTPVEPAAASSAGDGLPSQRHGISLLPDDRRVSRPARVGTGSDDRRARVVKLRAAAIGPPGGATRTRSPAPHVSAVTLNLIKPRGLARRRKRPPPTLGMLHPRWGAGGFLAGCCSGL